MSWSVAIPPTEASHVVQALHESDLQEVSKMVPESVEQFAVAKAAAIAIFESGAVGTEGYFVAGMSGHANPDHAARAGWANDMISLNIYRVSPPAE